uniref:Uncharacterized protein n=1 Tax=Anguilla anguilla TaxID=7936 RepID=A0A0E9SV94_ANGAN
MCFLFSTFRPYGEVPRADHPAVSPPICGVDETTS